VGVKVMHVQFVAGLLAPVSLILGQPASATFSAGILEMPYRSL